MAFDGRSRQALSLGLPHTPCGEFLEELVGHLLGGAVDQALAELRQLAADLGSTL